MYKRLRLEKINSRRREFIHAGRNKPIATFATEGLLDGKHFKLERSATLDKN
jgi:hypothetical protein